MMKSAQWRDPGVSGREEFRAFHVRGGPSFRRSLLSFCALVALVFLFAPPAQAEISAVHRVLPNGLTVILYPSHQAPTMTCRLFYVTGSVHERPGNTGIAHLLEHMLFKGTRKTRTRDSVADARLDAQIATVMDTLDALFAKPATDSGEVAHRVRLRATH